MIKFNEFIFENVNFDRKSVSVEIIPTQYCIEDLLRHLEEKIYIFDKYNFKLDKYFNTSINLKKFFKELYVEYVKMYGSESGYSFREYLNEYDNNLDTEEKLIGTYMDDKEIMYNLFDVVLSKEPLDGIKDLKKYYNFSELPKDLQNKYSDLDLGSELGTI